MKKLLPLVIVGAAAVYSAKLAETVIKPESAVASVGVKLGSAALGVFLANKIA